MSSKFDFVEYHDDGTIEIFGNKDGYPRYKGVIPAPDINHSSEEERQKTFDDACAAISLKGYLITSKRRIRNTAFDGRDQKTTLSVAYRACRNRREIESVHKIIVEILKTKSACRQIRQNSRGGA